MLVIGVVCWIHEKSQLPELRQCLDSLKQFRVILVDGKWYDIDHDQLTSIPEAYEMFKKYPNVEVITAVNRHEWQNRNLYLERCTPKDILIWVDTDEWLEVTGDVKELQYRLNPAFEVHFRGKMYTDGDVRQIRGLMYPSETRHTDRHNQAWYQGKEILCNAARPKDCIILHHDKSYRSEEREKAMRIRNRLKPFR